MSESQMSIDKVKMSNLWNEYCELLLSTKRPGIEKLIEWLEKTDFRAAPASTRYHGSYPHGLIEHSINTYKEAKKQKALVKLFDLSDETLIITSLLHDICKVEFYEIEMRNKKDELGVWQSVPYYTVNDLYPIGHGSKSVILAQNFIKLDEVEIAMIINHMGFRSGRDDREVSDLFSKFPESLVLHIADMTATYVVESHNLPDEIAAKLNSYKK